MVATDSQLGFRWVAEFQKVRITLWLHLTGDSSEPKTGDYQGHRCSTEEPKQEGNRHPVTGGAGRPRTQGAAKIVINRIGLGALQAFFDKRLQGVSAVGES